MALMAWIWKKDAASKASSSAPNVRGEGFRFAPAERTPDELASLRKRTAVISAFAGAGCALALSVIARHASLDFTFLVAMLMALTGFIAYDILSRRGWENAIVRQLDALNRGHEKLTREVARSRGEIAALKEGLSDTAAEVEVQARKAEGKVASVESKMLQTIARQLGALGHMPRTRQKGPAAAVKKRDDNVLELDAISLRASGRSARAAQEAGYADGDRYSDTVVLELVRHAVKEDQIDLFAQPVVSLPQRKVRFHELYGRIRAGRAGTYLSADRYLKQARQDELVGAIDNLILLRCLQLLRAGRHDESGLPCFLNIASSTLRDTGFMGDLVTFLAQNRKLAPRLVFEMAQEDLEGMKPALVPIIGGLAKLGCRFSMDQVSRPRFNIDLLKSRHVRFIKMDARGLMRAAMAPDGVARIRKMKSLFDTAGIDLIVEKIEDEMALRELLDFNIDYGQGYLFGKPDFHQAYIRPARKTAG